MIHGVCGESRHETLHGILYAHGSRPIFSMAAEAFQFGRPCVFTVFDFITPSTIAGLLLTLCQRYLRAVVNATGGRSVKAEELTDLLEAQKGFIPRLVGQWRRRLLSAHCRRYEHFSP